MIRFAAIGTASTGKSAVLNAVFGTRFAVDVRAGASAEQSAAIEFEGEQLEVIDTRPVESVFTRMQADAYLLVCDKDLIDLEYQQIVRIARPLGVAVNKSDTYSRPQMRQLLQQIRRRAAGIVPAERIVACAADPVRISYRQAPDERLLEQTVAAPPEVEALLPVIRELIAEAEGSIRVRTRKVALQTREAAVNWLRQLRF